MQLTSTNATIQAELELTRAKLASITSTLDDERRNHRMHLDDLRRDHRHELDEARREAADEADRLLRVHRQEMDELERRLKADVEEEQSRRTREVQESTTQAARERQNLVIELDVKDRELQNMRGSLEDIKGDLDREQTLNKNLRDNLSQSATESLSMETSMRALRSRIDFLESDGKAQSQAFADLEQRLHDAAEVARVANEKLLKEETLRRKLHNQVQELKGNIRVFCRVRPSLSSESVEEVAKIAFPDTDRESREIEVQGPVEKSALGNVTTKTNAFAFDHVFGPNSTNSEVFEEISQLVQSALDGYNVCIFCYGQTGSGKTYTMSATDGMIPRTVHQIYDTATSLADKEWSYRMEGSFVEVYNENLNDLLGKAEEFDKKKHEIRHDITTNKTVVTDVTTVLLDSPSRVEQILKRAAANRSVAATKANERSSRSHSVFILKLTGENARTGERSEGTLNLVDLAGSERLSHSGATGERLKETQNINRSLSCLGDVISALGQAGGQGEKGGHVPYRNSKVSGIELFCRAMHVQTNGNDGSC
jgi:kinesin family protein C1